MLLKRFSTTIIVCFLFHSAFSQEKIVAINNFTFDKEERKVYWVKVFEPSFSFNAEILKKYFTENNILVMLDGDSTSFRGTLLPNLSFNTIQWGYLFIKRFFSRIQGYL